MISKNWREERRNSRRRRREWKKAAKCSITAYREERREKEMQKLYCTLEGNSYPVLHLFSLLSLNSCIPFASFISFPHTCILLSGSQDVTKRCRMMSAEAVRVCSAASSTPSSASTGEAQVRHWIFNQGTGNSKEMKKMSQWLAFRSLLETERTVTATTKNTSE